MSCIMPHMTLISDVMHDASHDTNQWCHAWCLTWHWSVLSCMMVHVTQWCHAWCLTWHWSVMPFVMPYVTLISDAIHDASHDTGQWCHNDAWRDTDQWCHWWCLTWHWSVMPFMMPHMTLVSDAIMMPGVTLVSDAIMMPGVTLISDAIDDAWHDTDQWCHAWCHFTMHGVTLYQGSVWVTVGVSVGCVGPLTMNYNFISSTNWFLISLIENIRTTIFRLLHGPVCFTVLTLCTYADVGSREQCGYVCGVLKASGNIEMPPNHNYTNLSVLPLLFSWNKPLSSRWLYS